MSDEINVINRTQVIVVEPSSGSVAVTNAGPPGPAGPPGAAGGTTILEGINPPVNAAGSVGNYFLDSAHDILYGPKVATSPNWPVALIGAKPDPPLPVNAANLVPMENLPASTGFRSFPSLVSGNIKIDYNCLAIIVFSAYVDNAINNNDVALSIEFGGANAQLAGSRLEEVIYLGGRQPVQATLSLTFLKSFVPDITPIELKYAASLAGAMVKNVSFTVNILR